MSNGAKGMDSSFSTFNPNSLSPLLPFSIRQSDEHKGDLYDLAVQGLKTLGLYTEFSERGLDLFNL